MTRITNSDQVLILLRAHMQRSERAAKKPAAAAAERAAPRPLSRVQEMAADQGLSQGEIERALIAGLLAEEFGEGLANEARFQTMVSDVLRTIHSDESARALLEAAVAQLAQKAG